MAAGDCKAQRGWCNARDYEREDAERWGDSIAAAESVIDEMLAELDRWGEDVSSDARQWLVGKQSWLWEQVENFEWLLQARGWVVDDDGRVYVGGDDD